MRNFETLYQLAAERKGGVDALEALLPEPATAEVLASVPERRWLAEFSRPIFSSGLNWKVVEAKWEGIVAAYEGFDPDACAMIVEDRFDTLLTDPRVIRHGAKIRSVQENAVFIRDLRAEGGIGQVVGEWPVTQHHELLAMLKRRGSRLGGAVGAYALRSLGRDGYILTRDVTARLIAEGVIDKPATSKTAAQAVQEAFNTWMTESGRGLSVISKVLAFSV